MNEDASNLTGTIWKHRLRNNDLRLVAKVDEADGRVFLENVQGSTLTLTAGQLRRLYNDVSDSTPVDLFDRHYSPAADPASSLGVTTPFSASRIAPACNCQSADDRHDPKCPLFEGGFTPLADRRKVNGKVKL
jgi:hypothetical protein